MRASVDDDGAGALTIGGAGEEQARRLVEVGTTLGWGQFTLARFAADGLVVTVRHSPFAEAYGASAAPVCHLSPAACSKPWRGASWAGPLAWWSPRAPPSARRSAASRRGRSERRRGRARRRLGAGDRLIREIDASGVAVLLVGRNARRPWC